MTPTLQMVQVNPGNWKVVVTTTGIVLVEVKLRDEFAAYDWIKNYCTSFQAWSFEMVPLKTDKGEG